MKRARKIFTALVFSATTLLVGACGSGRPDAEIQSDIESQIQQNAELSSVSATVVDGDVTLLGQCKSDKAREEAEKSIKDVAGVGKVTNNIMVSQNFMVTSDADLRDNAKRVASKYGDVQTAVNNGIITLRGEIRKSKVQQLMMDLSALRPLRIENQLLVK